MRFFRRVTYMYSGAWEVTFAASRISMETPATNPPQCKTNGGENIYVRAGKEFRTGNTRDLILSVAQHDDDDDDGFGLAGVHICMET